MNAPLDLFQIKDGRPVWLGAAESLLQALELARQKGSGSYMVFSHQTGRRTTYQVDPTGAVRANNSALGEFAPPKFW
jgi:hypothetical protein